MRTLRALVAALVASATLTIPLFVVGAAGADPVNGGSAAAYGARLDLTDQNVLTEPEVSSTLADEDAAATVVDIPADPIAVSGTLTATAAVHAQSDLESQLLVNEQSVAGPYNALGFGEIEGAEVLVDAVGEGVPLLRADAVRAEAVAVCNGDTVSYGGQSEIVNLDIGGEDVPLNAPLEQLIDALNGVLADSGLNQVVDVQRNVVTQDASGASVDALRVTILAAAGDTPLGTVVLGHAEVADVTCGAPPECSDGADNDGDGVIDADDPGCHTDGDPNNPDSYDPNDDDETDRSAPQCSDESDNDGDGVIDAADPGCHTDGDPNNPDSYDPDDDDETNLSTLGDTPTAERGLPRTGADSTLGMAMLVGAAGLALLGLRRLRTPA